MTVKRPIVAHLVNGSSSGTAYGGVHGRSALVIGGSRGIGRAVTLALAEGGARVTALARDAGPLRELEAIAQAHRLTIETARGDAARPADHERGTSVDAAICRTRA